MVKIIFKGFTRTARGGYRAEFEDAYSAEGFPLRYQMDFALLVGEELTDQHIIQMMREYRAGELKQYEPLQGFTTRYLNKGIELEESS